MYFNLRGHLISQPKLERAGGEGVKVAILLIFVNIYYEQDEKDLLELTNIIVGDTIASTAGL